MDKRQKLKSLRANTNREQQNLPFGRSFLIGDLLATGVHESSQKGFSSHGFCHPKKSAKITENAQTELTEIRHS